MQLTHKFSPGSVRMTVTARDAMDAAGQEFSFFLDRHLSGDWGDVDQFECIKNDVASRTGGQIVSVYETLLGQKLWVVTSPIRHGQRKTVVCLPCENI